MTTERRFARSTAPCAVIERSSESGELRVESGSLAAGAAICYAAVISVITIIVTVYDKIAAKKRPKRRIRENTLLLLALLGGGAAEYLTMLLIRHKTLHRKFMIGLPVIIAVQAAAVILWWLYGK